MQVADAQEYCAHPGIGIDRCRNDLARGSNDGWFVFANDRCSRWLVPASR
jgi:hypothetical protein